MSLRFGFLVGSDNSGDQPADEVIEQHIERAVAARDAGVSTILAPHRYSFGPADGDDASMLHTWRLQPMLLLSHLAAILKDTVYYGTDIMLSCSSHPVELAEQVATLDTICHGRFRLGIGLGWMPYEFEAFGVDFAARGKRFEELLRTYRALASQEVVQSAGPYFPMASCRVIAHGPQRPMPPLWIGGSSDAAVRRAARHGDAWIMSAHTDLASLRRLQGVFSEERRRLGRAEPTQRLLTRQIGIAEDRDTAIQQFRPVVEEWYRRRSAWGWSTANESYVDESGRPTKEIGDRWIIGDPDDCVEQIERYQRELGVTDFIFGMAYPRTTHAARLKTIDLMGRHVLPKLTGA